jgi:hypothetical protein
MTKEDFKKEVERELTGRETQPWEIVYFKLYQSQMPVIERVHDIEVRMGENGVVGELSYG